MSGIQKLPKRIGLDTNIFIYYFQAHPRFGTPAKAIFEALAAHQTSAVTSSITLAELLAINSESKQIETLHTLLLETPRLTLYDLTQPIAFEAARIKRTYGYRLPDAIQLATSLYAKAELFITNDKRIHSFKEISVCSL